MNGKNRVLIVDDDDLIGATLSRVLKNAGYTVRAESGAEDVLKRIKSWYPDVVLLDITLPGRSGMEVLQEIVDQSIPTQVIMLTADDTAETAVKAMKLGAADYLTKPFNAEEVKVVLEKIIERGRLAREVDLLRRVQDRSQDREMIGQSRAMSDLRTNIERMAAAGVKGLLITGESGTGKEMLARQFHGMLQELAGGERKPYIAVNCAALPEHLLESELFGYEKGSFTDAKNSKKGVFELASGGVILLDEIGEMQLGLQSKLLRVLEERQVRHLGGAEDVPLDITVIATTNRSLSDAVQNGEFRNDLYYRLTSFHLVVPPLRDRPEDILPLARHFLETLARTYNKKGGIAFLPETEAVLVAYDWPGNVREMKNCIERLVVLGGGGMIHASQLPRSMTAGRAADGNAGVRPFVLPESGISLDDLERDIIHQALERTGGNKTQAAKLLHLTYDTLRYQVKKFGLE